MANTALVTGASGGIGMALAREHAQRGGDLVLVARSEQPMQDLKAELESKHGIKVTVLVADLMDPAAAAQVFAETEAQNLHIDVLINNAGLGGHGKFYERKLEDDLNMIQLNITTLTTLTHLYLQAMVSRGKGKILNVSSTASFMPGPLQGVYYASKAFVTSFSQAIAEELKGTGVTVTALCPGAVKSSFQKAGNLEGIDLWKNAKSPEQCAKIAYRDMEKGELLSFNEGQLKFMLNWVVPFMPRKMVLKVSRQAMEK